MDWPTALVIISIVVAACLRMDAALEALRRYRERRLRIQLEFADLDKLHSELVRTAERGEHSQLMLSAADALENLALENGRLKAELSERMSKPGTASSGPPSR